MSAAPPSGRGRTRGARCRRALRAIFGSCVFAAGAMSLAGCSAGAPSTMTVSAVFSDVSDLVAGAPVQFDDIAVGSVKSITLDGSDAKVTMSIDKGADVPADVSAKLEQTSILGDYFVALVPASDSGPPMTTGEVIHDTQLVPGIQQLVSAGTEVFSAVNAAELAEMIDNGAQGFGNQSAQLGELIDDFDTVLGGYASRSTEIQSVITQLDKFSSTLAPDAQQNAEAVSNLAQTTQTLSQQSSQFETLLESLNDLAVQGRSLLDTGVPQTEDQLNALAALANQLAQNQKGLAELLEYLPGHNYTVSTSIDDNYVQVLNDLIVCGVPGGGANPNYATSTCGGAS